MDTSFRTLLHDDLLRFMAKEHQEVFYNERDFQMHLAIYLKGTNHYDDVDVEYYVPHIQKNKDLLPGYPWKSEVRIDIVVKKGDEWQLVELKYKLKEIVASLSRFGKNMGTVQIVKEQGAQDLGKYDFWKDVKRIEVVKKNFKNVSGGFAIFLTNDKMYMSSSREGTNAYYFGMASGHPSTKDKYKRGLKYSGYPDFTLEKSYDLTWMHNCRFPGLEDAKNGEFYYCIAEV